MVNTIRNTTQWPAQLNQLPAERLSDPSSQLLLILQVRTVKRSRAQHEQQTAGDSVLSRVCVCVCVREPGNTSLNRRELYHRLFFPDKTQCTKQGQQGSIVAPKQKSAEPAGRQRQRQPGQNKRSHLHPPPGLLPRFTAGAEYQTGRVDKKCRERVRSVYLAAA